MQNMEEEQLGVHLLNELLGILESDPHIDEVGFVHPSQIAMLGSKQEGTSGSEQVLGVFLNASFWSRDHKLAISTQVVLPLYKAAKCSLMGAINEYKTACCSSSDDTSIPVESEVMKHSKALLLVSYDFGTAWHSRKSIVSTKRQLAMYLDELQVSTLVLSYAPKCEHAWSHRRWAIKSISGICPTLQQIIGNESDLVEKIAERSKMNYRAWNHRCWLVSYMSVGQAVHELNRTRNWASLHVADNSCFHYRRRLMARILKGTGDEPTTSTPLDLTVDVHQLWKDELDWNKSLIQLYVGREGLWLHRRFLALVLVKRLSNDYTKTDTNNDTTTFLDSEFGLLESCSNVHDSQFEDHQAQALYSATYMLWLVKQIPQYHGIEFLRAEKLKSMLKKACPEKPFLWDNLLCKRQS